MNNRNAVLFRVDGNTDMGLGHLVRSLALATMLGAKFEITFCCKAIPADLKAEISKNGFHLQLLRSENEFFSQLKPGNVVVLDGYQFDENYQKKIKLKECPLVVIDDLYEQKFYADLIINHAPGVSSSDYNAEPYTRFALGPDYALLRSSFLRIAGKPGKPVDANETVLICFGGSDAKNLTLSTVKTVLNFNRFKKIIIVAGSAYRFQKELIRFCEGHSATEYHCSVNDEQMAALMVRAGVAIVPASGILFEALAAGCIAVSGTYTDNQKQVYKGFKDLNAIIDAGSFEKNQITDAINSIRTYRQQNFIDGKSPGRLQHLFKELSARN